MQIVFSSFFSDTMRNIAHKNIHFKERFGSIFIKNKKSRPEKFKTI
ncbi:MAG: hypothetical protein RLZZ540_2459 [Bacteroidota bacterium]|jgi:hypothetical protein